MKTRYLLIAGGVDQKGIVFNLTKILKNYKFNIEDSSMVMLRRTFSVIMLLSGEKGALPQKLQKEMEAFSKKYSMTLDIKKITEKEMKEYPGEGSTYTISISGADKPGIVNAITEKLYKSGANIIDLETKSSEKVKPHAYYMFLEVSMPGKDGVKALEKTLSEEAKKLGVHVSVNEVIKAIL